MAHPKSPPALSASAPAGPFFTTPEQRVALARERFFEEGVRPSGLVPEPVIQSWSRCLDARRAPQERVSFDPVTKSRVASTLARNRQLLDAAAADLQQLDAALSGTACKAFLTSHDGIVVHATPTRRGEGQLMPVVTRVGVNLSESAIGTGAPGVTARTGEVCVVHGAEHFFSGLRVMHCAAAPIHDSHGLVAAVLDLSSEGQAFRFDALTMVRQFAAVIENRLLVAQSNERLLLRFQVSPALLHTPLEGLAAVHPDGRIAWLNGIAASLLGSPRRPAAHSTSEALLGLSVEQLLNLSHRGDPQPHALPSRLGVWLQARWTGPAVSTVSATSAVRLRPDALDRQPANAHLRLADPAAPPSGPADPMAPSAPAASPASTTLDDANRALIEQTLQRHGGNVSRTARELRVSRGLLYRRLKAWQREWPRH